MTLILFLKKCEDYTFLLLVELRSLKAQNTVFKRAVSPIYGNIFILEYN